MAMSQTKLYIGCGLTHASDFTSQVEELKLQLRKDYEVFEFLGLEKGSAADVYHWDIETCVAGCDLFVAICDFASIGLGYEIAAAALAYKKPVLAVAQSDALVTRLILGARVPNFSFARYNHMSDIPKLIQAKLETISKNY